ncbi:hypothetical protein LTR28_008809 [Elasticomyces elasticus]|nr:hypothetical protein LTR28_008809 [Elasticomyces elasticus]
MPSESEPASQPPPYSSLDATTTNPPTDILDFVAATLAKEQSTLPAPAKADVDRLRNFLAYLLTVDYQVSTKLELHAKDWEHYQRMSTYLLDFGDFPDYLNKEERAVLGQFFWHHLQNPAKALGVPVDLVILAIHRFKRHVDVKGDYKSTPMALLHANGLDSLAQKLYNDREIMIPRLFPADQVDARKIMFEQLQGMQNRHFAEITGMTSRSKFTEGTHWTPIWHVDYVLNARGIEYEQAQSRGCARQVLYDLEKPLPEIQHERIASCLAHLKQRLFGIFKQLLVTQQITRQTTQRITLHTTPQPVKPIEPYGWRVPFLQFAPALWEPMLPRRSEV